ncbi:MAG: VanZ family protein [Oscillospiraceae bacterium]|nr:VanZ family protein [Oscillospiraceae bacterium]
MKKNKKWILYIAAAAVLVFIWTNSMQDQAHSVAASNSLKEFILAKLSFFVDDNSRLMTFIQTYIRKCAHFIEFTLLGAVLMTILTINKKTSVQNIYNIFSFSVIVAVIDEFVQRYTGRGPNVKDVVIDSVGSLFGIFLVFDIYWISVFIRYMSKKRKSQQKILKQ